MSRLRHLLALPVLSLLGACIIVTEPANTRVPNPVTPQDAADPVEPESSPVAVAQVVSTPDAPEPESSLIDWEQLPGTWYEDHDRRDGDRRVFVRVDPGPSRFRARYVFEPTGKAQMRILHRSDRHYMLHGEWSRTGRLVLVRANKDGRLKEHRLRVLELNEDELVFRRR